MITCFEILSYASNMLTYASAAMIFFLLNYIVMLPHNVSFHQHNYYDYNMNTFDSKYLFGDFLEDSKFDELSDYLQFHFQKKNIGNDMSKGNIPMHALIFSFCWETKILHTIFSYIFTSLSNYMRCGKTLDHMFLKV